MKTPKRPKASKKVRKSLTIEQRVDLLMREGVDYPEKWATIHGYEEPIGDACDFDWYNEWQRLRKYHLVETNFLFDVIRELVKRHEHLQERWDNACDEAAERDMID